MTKVFHDHATIKHRRKLISVLEDHSGSLQSDHSIKASILWDSLKDRLGQREYQDMQLDLGSLLQASFELGCLEECFTSKEIDDVIRNLPTDKSPGLDGFNTDFIKRCWPIIKQDFYNLCHAFFSGEIYLQSTNGSYITLIPKGEGGTKSQISGQSLF